MATQSLFFIQDNPTSAVSQAMLLRRFYAEERSGTWNTFTQSATTADTGSFASQTAVIRTHDTSRQPVVLGPMSFAALSGQLSDTPSAEDLKDLLEVYFALIESVRNSGHDWLQFDEPILTSDLSLEWKQAFEQVYHTLKSAGINLMVNVYGGRLGENLQLACNLPVAGLHVDTTTDRSELIRLLDWLPVHKVLSLGITDGSGAKDADISSAEWIRPLKKRLGLRLKLASDCSLDQVATQPDTSRLIRLIAETEKDPVTSDNRLSDILPEAIAFS